MVILGKALQPMEVRAVKAVLFWTLQSIGDCHRVAYNAHCFMPGVEFERQMMKQQLMNHKDKMYNLRTSRHTCANTHVLRRCFAKLRSVKPLKYKRV